MVKKRIDLNLYSWIMARISNITGQNCCNHVKCIQLLADLHVKNNLKIYFLTELFIALLEPPFNLHH